jgi:GT2 family glycosyltransferase
MIAASVIICAHNPRDKYLERVLGALEAQTFDKKYWELLLVDNASNEALERKWNISWHPDGRHIREDKLGLSWARQRGIQDSRGGILIFVDDDNVLPPGYLETAVRLANEWPILGAWGAGAILPEFEAEPSEHLKDYLPWLALRDLDSPRWTNVMPPCVEASPWGAGLCVRRAVAEAYCKFSQNDKTPITGRRGQLLLCGEDDEICYTACSVGMGVATFPDLRLTHLIPKERILEPYLMKLVEGTMLSKILLAHKWFGTTPPPFSMSSILALGYRVLTTCGFHRRKYIAWWRASLKARQIIQEAVPGPKSCER